jgi:hypothetical protein
VSISPLPKGESVGRPADAVLSPRTPMQSIGYANEVSEDEALGIFLVRPSPLTPPSPLVEESVQMTGKSAKSASWGWLSASRLPPNVRYNYLGDQEHSVKIRGDCSTGRTNGHRRKIGSMAFLVKYRSERERGLVFGKLSKLRRIVYAGTAIFILASVDPCNAEESYGAAPPDINAHLDRLVRSYPDWISDHDNEFLILKNGTKFPISDHRTNKSFDEPLESPDIDDMFFAPYPVGTKPQQPSKNSDPGIYRGATGPFIRVTLLN